MSDFGDLPFRTRSSAAGYKSWRPSHTMPTTQSNAGPPRVYAEPMEMPGPATHTDRPTAATESERTPSPFIKKEPVNDDLYSPYTVQNHAEYDPRQSIPLQARQAASLPLAYDPAHMDGSALPSFSRILSSIEGEMAEPPTVCFTSPYRNQQLTHVLVCHGETKTQKPVACGSNCQLVAGATIKALKGAFIVCEQGECGEKRQKRLAGVFMPKKRTTRAARTTPYPEPAARKAQKAKQSSTRDEKTLELNQMLASDPALAALADTATGPGARRKSKRHGGFALQQEIREEAETERFLDAAGIIDIDLDEAPRLKREMKKLHVDGTKKLGGMAGVFGPGSKTQEIDTFALPDKEFGADTENEKPWSYSSSGIKGKQSIRSKNAGMFSMPVDTYNDMVEEENGVVMEQEDTRRNRSLRHQIQYTEEEDEGEGGRAGAVEECALCGDLGDGALYECTGCRSSFHRLCAGKEDLSYLDGALNLGYRYEGPWNCDTCGDTMRGSRYVCIHPACQDFDYCEQCAHAKAETHAEEMLAYGDDSKGHRFAEIYGALGPALKALRLAEETEFLCSECEIKQTANVQAIASQSFSKKSSTKAGEKNTKGRSRVQKKIMQSAAFKNDMQNRIRDNKNRVTKQKANSSRKGVSRSATKNTHILPIIAEEDAEMEDGDALQDASLWGA